MVRESGAGATGFRAGDGRAAHDPRRPSRRARKNTNSSKTLDPADPEFIDTEGTADPVDVDVYAEAEAKVEVEEARKALRRARQEREEAEDVLPALRGRLQRGDAGVTALDMAAASMAEERAELLLKGCEARLKRVMAAGPGR